jgi:hypothetical protein
VVVKVASYFKREDILSFTGDGEGVVNLWKVAGKVNVNNRSNDLGNVASWVCGGFGHG